MVREIQTPDATDTLSEVFDNEDEFNDSLKRYPEPLEQVLDIELYQREREQSVEFGHIDIFAHVRGTQDDTVVIESQLGELDNDHIARGLKYAINQEATALVYIADQFSTHTQQLLGRINHNEDDLYIFALTPAIGSVDEPVTMYFETRVSPDDWNDYLNGIPQGTDLDRVKIFDFLERELGERDLHRIERNTPAPTHSGFYEDGESGWGEYELFYSVKNQTRTDAVDGSGINNINLRIQKPKDDSTGAPQEEARRLIEENQQLLDQHFESYHAFTGWGSWVGLTFDADFDANEHRAIAEWFADTRETLADIHNELQLDIE